MLPLSVPAAKAVGTGQVQMIVKYAGVPIWTQLDDLCDKAACPISAGPTEVRRPASSCPELLPAVSAFVAPEMPAAASGAVNCRPACSQRAAGWQHTWHRRKSTRAEVTLLTHLAASACLHRCTTPSPSLPSPLQATTQSPLTVMRARSSCSASVLTSRWVLRSKWFKGLFVFLGLAVARPRAVPSRSECL
jgi:hypothetical protein